MKVLDCTLRDGGYCNNWEFGYVNIKKIISGLCNAGIDFVECGFVTDKVNYVQDITQYNHLGEIAGVLPQNTKGTQFVCMVNYGEFDINQLPNFQSDPPNGIRLAFHKRDLDAALNVGRKIKEKGYALFLQPMVSLSYTDEEFLSLIKKCNGLNPYAFYIVDSFGVMKQKELIRYYCLVEHNLSDGVAIGFHAHNNMQLAYSNAQKLLQAGSAHELIIDSSVLGMGRGAGNLNTELFVEYLNDYYQACYESKPLLNIIDEVLNQFYKTNHWGYSLPNYLSAKHNIHPNYAGYLDAKRTLTMDNIDDIFSMMDDSKKASYDKNYIEQLYVQYLASGDVADARLSEFREKLSNKTVMVIAPGKSSLEEQDKILAAIDENVVTISVNFDYAAIETDYVFLSNLRRYREFPNRKINKCIITSNIPSADAYIKTGYKELLNGNEYVMDNAGLMLIKFLIGLKCENLFLAGFDGYDIDAGNNFANTKMQPYLSKEWAESTNFGLNEVLQKFHRQISMKFITTPKFIRLYV